MNNEHKTLRDKHVQTLSLLTRLNDIDEEWSNLRNELIELQAFNEGKKTIERIHKEILQTDKVIINKMNTTGNT